MHLLLDVDVFQTSEKKASTLYYRGMLICRHALGMERAISNHSSLIPPWFQASEEKLD